MFITYFYLRSRKYIVRKIIKTLFNSITVAITMGVNTIEIPNFYQSSDTSQRTSDSTNENLYTLIYGTNLALTIGASTNENMDFKIWHQPSTNDRRQH